MKLTLKFPMHFRAKPRRARGLRDVVVSHPFAVDVPEISRREANVVFEARQSYDFTKRMTLVPHTFRMLEHDGRLYRRLATASRVETVTKDAFAKDWISANYPFAENISIIGEAENTNPVAKVLQRQIEWCLEADSKGRDRKENTWPTPYARSSKKWGITETLNGKLFQDVASELSEIDGEAVARATRDFEHQAAKLLFVDDELWIASPPPAICVEHSYDKGKIASINLAILPEGPTSRPATVYFPLDRRDDAERYAHLLAYTIVDDRKVGISDATVPFSADGGELLAFSQEEVELRNTCHNLVAANERYIQVADPDYVAAFMTDAMREEQAIASAKACEADFVRGEYHDLSEHFDMTATLWKKCRRPAYQFDFPGIRKKQGDLILARGYELLENAPISVFTQSRSPRL